jgi:hypothetical protein
MGETVARLRGERTQQAVADAMRRRDFRWSQATVWAVESGERPLRASEAEALARVLDVPLDSIYRLPDEAFWDMEASSVARASMGLLMDSLTAMHDFARNQQGADALLRAAEAEGRDLGSPSARELARIVALDLDDVKKAVEIACLRGEDWTAAVLVLITEKDEAPEGG